MHIVIGIIIIAIGAFIVIKSEKVYNTFGSIAFFDRYLGAEGGGRLGYKLIGMLFIIIGILVSTNMIGGFISWILSPLLRYSQPGTGF